MSQYYQAKRTRGLYDPKSPQPFKLSRSKIELFIECPRCFYLDRRLGISRPPGFPFNLNSAVDTLLKKEFDIHRAKQVAHPLMKTYKIDAVPFTHPDLNKWRENFVGVQYLHVPTNLLVTGAVDDVWQYPSTKELIVVDYKSTSKTPPLSIDAPWQDGYKRQMEIYQWLLRHKGHAVSDTGYFVYANGRRDREAFDGRLEFDVDLIAYKGNDHWVETTLMKIKAALMADQIPRKKTGCDFCSYCENYQSVTKSAKKIST